jgi:hypothetical protein
VSRSNGVSGNRTPVPSRNADARNGEKASNKQNKFLTDLATQRGLSLSDLNADVSRRFGVSGLYDLSRKEASLLLDELSGKQRQAA